MPKDGTICAAWWHYQCRFGGTLSAVLERTAPRLGLDRWPLSLAPTLGVLAACGALFEEWLGEQHHDAGRATMRHVAICPVGDEHSPTPRVYAENAADPGGTLLGDQHARRARAALESVRGPVLVQVLPMEAAITNALTNALTLLSGN